MSKKSAMANPHRKIRKHGAGICYCKLCHQRNGVTEPLLKEEISAVKRSGYTDQEFTEFKDLMKSAGSIVRCAYGDNDGMCGAEPYGDSVFCLYHLCQGDLSRMENAVFNCTDPLYGNKIIIHPELIEIMDELGLEYDINSFIISEYLPEPESGVHQQQGE